MNKYAILQIKSKQYFVKEGSTISVPKIDKDTNFEVLLIKDEKDVTIGTPIVEKGGLKLTNLGNKRVKVEVRRYKGKSRYRKNKSHTDEYTVIRVDKIDMAAAKTTVLKAKPEEKQEKKIVKKAAAKAKPTKTSLSTLKLTDSVLKRLEKQGIKTVEDLKSKSKDDLVAIKGLGEKTVDSILRKLK